MRFDDYLLRAIEQLSLMIAAIVAKLRAGDVDDAERELAHAYDALLGGDRVFLDMVDAETLARVLGSPEKTRLLAQLSHLEAQACERKGDSLRAEGLRQRARDLLAIAHRDAPQEDDATLLRDLDAR